MTISVTSSSVSCCTNVAPSRVFTYAIASTYDLAVLTSTSGVTIASQVSTSSSTVIFDGATNWPVACWCWMRASSFLASVEVSLVTVSWRRFLVAGSTPMSTTNR